MINTVNSILKLDSQTTSQWNEINVKTYSVSLTIIVIYIKRLPLLYIKIILQFKAKQGDILSKYLCHDRKSFKLCSIKEKLNFIKFFKNCKLMMNSITRNLNIRILKRSWNLVNWYFSPEIGLWNMRRK